MARPISSLFVEIAANTATLQRDLGKATRILDREAAKWDARVKKFSTVLGAAFGGLSAAALTKGIRSVMEFSDTLVNTAERVGQSVESIQALRNEAEKVGLSIEGTDNALQRFSRLVGEARNAMLQTGKAGGTLGKVFEQYNISLKDAAGKQKSLAALLEEFRGLLDSTADPAERNRIAMAGFGKEGVKLGQVLAGLGGTIEQTTSHMIKQGRVMREDSVRAMAALESKYTEVMQSLNRLWMQFVSNTVLGWQQMIEGFDRGAVQLQLGFDTSGIDIEIRAAKEKIAELSKPAKGSWLKTAEQNEVGRMDALKAAQQELVRLETERARIVQQIAKNREFEFKGMQNIGAGLGTANTAAAATADQIEKIAKALKLTDKGAENLRNWFPTIEKAAAQTGIRIEVLLGKINRESRFANFAATGSSARGPSQIIEGTAKRLSQQYGLSLEALRRGTDGWIQNIEAGALYLRDQMKGARSEVEGLAKYFLGPGTVAKKGIDVTAGNNAGLTGRGYAQRILQDADKIAAALGAENDQFQRQIDLLKEGEAVTRSVATAQEQYVARVRELTELLNAGVISQTDFDRALKAAQASMDGSNVALQEQLALLERAGPNYDRLMASLDPTVAATQEYAAAVQVVNEALAANAISQEQATSAIEAARNRFDQAMAGMQESAMSLQDSVAQTVQQGIGGMIQSLIDGTERASDALKNLAKQIAAMAIQYALFGGGSGGGLLGGLFAKGGYGQLALPHGVYSRPTAFSIPGSGVRRFAKGIGILGEAGPEAIMPLTRTSGGKLGVTAQTAPVNVTVNNYTPDNVSVQETPRVDGGRDVTIMVNEAVRAEMRRGGYDRTMRQTYGVPRRGY